MTCKRPIDADAGSTLPAAPLLPASLSEQTRPSSGFSTVLSGLPWVAGL